MAWAANTSRIENFSGFASHFFRRYLYKPMLWKLERWYGGDQRQFKIPGNGLWLTAYVGERSLCFGFSGLFSGRSWVILQKTFPQGFSKWNVDGKITPACCWNPFDKPMHYRLFDFWFASCCFARSAAASGMTPRCWCTCYLVPSPQNFILVNRLALNV